MFWVVPADVAAARMLRAARHGAGTVYVPSRWRYVTFVLKCIPSFVFRRLPV
jgi:hypothetical protein